MSKIGIPSLQEIMEDVLDPKTDTEISRMTKEIQEVVNTLKDMDPVLALKVKKMAEDFLFGFEDIRGYLRLKAEDQKQQ